MSGSAAFLTFQRNCFLYQRLAMRTAHSHVSAQCRSFLTRWRKSDGVVVLSGPASAKHLAMHRRPEQLA